MSWLLLLKHIQYCKNYNSPKEQTACYLAKDRHRITVIEQGIVVVPVAFSRDEKPIPSTMPDAADAQVSEVTYDCSVLGDEKGAGKRLRQQWLVAPEGASHQVPLLDRINTLTVQLVELS